MSGHSKWANIKHKKMANDAKKAQIFAKLSRLITLAVQEHGGITDPNSNVKLRLIIERARAENMPRANIDRAIEKAKGSPDVSVKEVMYEGFGPGGSAVLVSAMTDNPNRTTSFIKSAFDRNGGKLGGANSVSYLFEKCGIVLFSHETVTEQQAFSMADSLDALEIESDEHGYTIYIPFEKLGHVDTSELKPMLVEPFFKPKVSVTVNEKDYEAIQDLVGALEDLDDVDKAFTNAITV